ncbi:MAG: hypothetical protein IPL78_33710 [Chloroflexi bacterium]|nr:hypothetical protein [Chloroflexota bacterium]
MAGSRFAGNDQITPRSGRILCALAQVAAQGCPFRPSGVDHHFAWSSREAAAAPGATSLTTTPHLTIVLAQDISTRA